MKLSKVKMPDGTLVDPERDMLVEYLGANIAMVRYRGPSGTVYRFSGARRQRTVCAVDAAWFARLSQFAVKELPASPAG